MLAASTLSMTQFLSTPQEIAILSFKSLSRGFSLRQMIISGLIPMRLSSPTLCCVGLVLSSPAALMKGTKVRWIFIALFLPTSSFRARMASKKGKPSMSPTVPPISTIKMSLFSPALIIRSLISPTMCGITCIVLPRYSPLLSFSITL